MSQVEIEGANLRDLIQRVCAGDEVTLTERGHALARMVAASGQDARTEPRRLGELDGQYDIPDDFDRPLPDDLLDLFEGKA